MEEGGFEEKKGVQRERETDASRQRIRRKYPSAEACRAADHTERGGGTNGGPIRGWGRLLTPSAAL